MWILVSSILSYLVHSGYTLLPFLLLFLYVLISVVLPRSVRITMMLQGLSLQKATDISPDETTMSRLLVIRAIDDEASLALAAGAILNRLIPKITHIILLAVPIIIISGSILFSLKFERVSIDQRAIFPDIVSGFFAFIKSSVFWVWFPSII